MSLLDTLKKNLTPEQFNDVQEALGDDFDFDMVPRTRLNKVIKQRNEARTELSALLDASESNGSGNEGNHSDEKSYTQAELDAAVETEKQNNEKAIAAMQKRYAVTDKLRGANFIDPDLVLAAGLIDLSKVTLDDKGVITGGLDDQLSSLAESKPYLKDDASGAQRGTGKNGGSDKFGAVTSRDDFLKLSLEKQIEFKEANPEVFESFMK